MKRKLLTLLFLGALFGCSKADVVSDDTDGVAIDFNNVQTRAAITDASQIQDFGVWGFVEDYTIFNGDKVYKEGGVYKYDTPRYWMKDMSYSFFAVHPYGTPVTIDETGETRGYSIAFDTPVAADVDLMTAHKDVIASVDSEGNYPTVDLKFAHALSLVKLQIAKHGKNSENRIVITSIVLGGISKSGTYNTLTNEWSDHNGSISLSTANITLDNGDITFHEVITGMFVPQSINYNTVSIRINYDFYTSNGEGEWVPDEESYTANSYLPIGEWEPSKSYVYKLTLSAVDNNISFKSPEVATWGTPNPSGTIIIQ